MHHLAPIPWGNWLQNTCKSLVPQLQSRERRYTRRWKSGCFVTHGMKCVEQPGSKGDVLLVRPCWPRNQCCLLWSERPAWSPENCKIFLSNSYLWVSKTVCMKPHREWSTVLRFTPQQADMKLGSKLETLWRGRAQKMCVQPSTQGTRCSWPSTAGVPTQPGRTQLNQLPDIRKACPCIPWGPACARTGVTATWCKTLAIIVEQPLALKLLKVHFFPQLYRGMIDKNCIYLRNTT